MKTVIQKSYDNLLIQRFAAEDDEIDDVVSITEGEVWLVMKFLQECHPGRSVWDYLQTKFGS